MKSFWHTIGAGALLASTVVGTYVCTARAGAKPADQVSIDPVARTAHGSFGSAHNSSDGNQFIFCYVHAFGGALDLYCRAANSGVPTPLDVTCTSTNATLIGNIQKLATDADVTFTWDTSGHCTSVLIDRGSKWELKNP